MKKKMFKNDSDSLRVQNSYIGLLQERCNAEISKYSLHANEQKEFITTISSAVWLAAVT